MVREPAFATSNYWLNAVMPDYDWAGERDAPLAAANDAGLMCRPAWISDAPSTDVSQPPTRARSSGGDDRSASHQHPFKRESGSVVAILGEELGRKFMLPLEVPAFGGELPLGCDPLLADPIALSASCLAFSHGRAALRWLCQWRGHFDCAVLSAYTCPTVIDLLDSLGIRMRFVDILHGDWEAVVRTENGRLLVLVPAFLGHDPDADLPALATAVGEHGLVLVDAAQTAFGHLSIEELDNVAVLSDPRKCTALGDGAILRMRGVSEAERAFVKTLPWAMGPVAAKISARWLMACRSPANEPDALALVAQAERGWPDTPHRMSDAGLWWLSWLDPHAHARARQRNWAALAQALGDAVEVVRLSGGVPFNLSILVDDRANLLARLRAARVFATPLWPNARQGSDHCPRAADFMRRLVGLPIDQRYTELDMHELAKRVRLCLRH